MVLQEIPYLKAILDLTIKQNYRQDVYVCVANTRIVGNQRAETHFDGLCV